MALLTEIDEIERNSTLALPELPPLPLDENGQPDANHPDFDAITAERAVVTALRAAISDARRLRAKVRIIIMIHAKALLAGQRLPVLDRTDPENPVPLRDPYPATPQETNEAIGWAQNVLANLDGQPLETAFRAALVNDPNVNSAALPAAFIRALGSSTSLDVDEALRLAFIPILPVLAKGSHPGR